MCFVIFNLVFAVYLYHKERVMTKKATSVPAQESTSEMTSSKQLGFLEDFMHVTGACQADMARALGLTRGGISHAFRSDDMKISMCYRFVDSLGYDLEFKLEKEDYKYVSDSVTVRITMKEEPIDDPSSNVYLRFLSTALLRYHISKKDLAETLQITYNTVRHWFMVDDIYISHIYRIARLFDLSLRIAIKPKKA